MKKLIFFILVAAIAVSANAAEFRRAQTLEDVHHATFRVSVAGARGTATFVGVDERGAILLTNHHVVSNSKTAVVEGWGHFEKRQLKGVVDWRCYDKDEPYDFAEIVVDENELKRMYDPPFVALAGDDCDLDDAQFISAGAPRGAHVTAWKGVELGKYNNRTIMFSPPPAPGQSGSLLVAKIDGEWWGVAVLTWRFGRDGDDSATGGAIPISLYYQARGAVTKSPAASPSLPPIPEDAVEVAAYKARIRVYTSPSQCVPCSKLEPVLNVVEQVGIPIERIDALGEQRSIAEKDGVKEIPTIYAVDENNKVSRILTPDELNGEDAQQKIIDAYNFAAIPIETAKKEIKQEEPIYTEASSNGIVDSSLGRWHGRTTKEDEPQIDETIKPRFVTPIENVQDSIEKAARRVARRALIGVFFCVVAGVLLADTIKKCFLVFLKWLGGLLKKFLKKLLTTLD